MGIYTIGHSNRLFTDFLSLLKEYGIQLLVDIRRYPGSHKFPHFNRELLHKQLTEQNIAYLWLEALGGRRRTGKNTNSPNIGMKSLGFRNYADYMITNEFQVAVRELIFRATKSLAAVMCAEKLYWKCHRRLLSDYLFAQGIKVDHIIDTDRITTHTLTPGAVITDESSVVYPATASEESPENLLFGD